MAWRGLALVAALVLLHLCGRGGLAPPSIGTFRPGRAGAPSRPIIETAMAIIRLAALGAGAYLLLIVTVALIGRSLGHRPTLRLAARLTPPGLRTILALATTAGVAVGVTSPIADAAGSPSAPAATPPVLRWTAPPATVPVSPPTLRWTAPASGPATPPILRWTALSPLRSAPSSHSVESGTAGRPTPPSSRGSRPVARAEPRDPHDVATAVGGRSLPAPPRPVRRPPPGRANPSTYVVRPGDNFWSIAASQVGANVAISRDDDQRVAQYWRLLVAANRHNLPVAGHPDLLFPGDRIDLPPVS